MKLKQIKKYLEVYYKRVAQRRREVEKEELNLLWNAIKIKAKRDKEKKEKEKAKENKRPKNPVSKKLEYDTDD